MRYTLFLHYPEMTVDELGEEGFEAGKAAFHAYTKALDDAGVLVSAEVLQPSGSSTTLTVRDGRARVQDGPYADTKEQIGGTFVLEVPDLDAAIRHWVSLGVGPFFLLEHIAFAECSYRGKPARFDLSVAIGQWGPVQVELIRQHDDVPSIYTRFDGSRAGGLQHVGVMTDSVAAKTA